MKSICWFCKNTDLSSDFGKTVAMILNTGNFPTKVEKVKAKIGNAGNLSKK